MLRLSRRDDSRESLGDAELEESDLDKNERNHD
jgi:hypothetical protein